MVVAKVSDLESSQEHNAVAKVSDLASSQERKAALEMVLGAEGSGSEPCDASNTYESCHSSHRYHRYKNGLSHQNNKLLSCTHSMARERVEECADGDLSAME